MSKSGLNTALRGIADRPKNFVIHDLRRTVRTYLSELGVATNVAELCLNHRPTDIRKVYDRAELLDQRYDALLRWEAYLDTLLSDRRAEPANTTFTELEALIERSRGDQKLREYVISRLLKQPV